MASAASRQDDDGRGRAPLRRLHVHDLRGGRKHNAQSRPQQEGRAGDRQTEEKLHQVPGSGGPERAEHDARRVVRAPEDRTERAHARPHEDAVHHQQAGNADARRKLQRVVVGVVGNGGAAGVTHVLDRLELGEHEAEGVGAPPEERPLLDGGEGRLPDLRPRLAAAPAELEDRGETLAEVHDVVRAGEAAPDDAHSQRGADPSGDPVETAHVSPMPPCNDAEHDQTDRPAYPGAAREGDDEGQPVESEAGPVDQPPHQVLLGEGESQSHRHREDQEAPEQVGVAVGREGTLSLEGSVPHSTGSQPTNCSTP